MKLFKNALIIFSFFFAGMYVTTAPLFAQVITVKRIDDILKSPAHYYNNRISIKGKVMSIQKEENSANGSYVFKDEKGTEIAVVSEMLPAVGKTYHVTMDIKEKAGSSVPVFQEVSRKPVTKFKNLIYIFAAIGVVLVGALVFGGSGESGQGTIG